MLANREDEAGGDLQRERKAGKAGGGRAGGAGEGYPGRERGGIVGKQSDVILLIGIVLRAH